MPVEREIISQMVVDNTFVFHFVCDIGPYPKLLVRMGAAFIGVIIAAWSAPIVLFSNI